VVKNGDRITIDAGKSVISLDLPPKELKTRLKAWKPRKARETRGVLAKYAKLVTSASEGAVTDKYL
jgi:dihydroxy-acid dehydratase